MRPRPRWRFSTRTRWRAHTLVIPRDHHRRIGELSLDLAAAVFTALCTVVPAVERAVGADAVTVRFNDGEASGQTVPHVHGHVIPRFEDDALANLPPVDERPDSTGDRDAVAAAIRERIGRE